MNHAAISKEKDAHISKTIQNARPQTQKGGQGPDFTIFGPVDAENDPQFRRMTRVVLALIATRMLLEQQASTSARLVKPS